MQFFCLHVFAIVKVLFDRQTWHCHLCFLILCYWIDCRLRPRRRLDMPRTVTYDYADFKPHNSRGRHPQRLQMWIAPQESRCALPAQRNTQSGINNKIFDNVNACGTGGLRAVAHGVYISNRSEWRSDWPSVQTRFVIYDQLYPSLNKTLML